MAGSLARSARMEGRSAWKPSLVVARGEARLVDLPPSQEEVERSLEEGLVVQCGQHTRYYRGAHRYTRVNA